MKSFKDLYKLVKKKYDNLDTSIKENILFFFNYFINSVPISIFIYIVMSLRMEHNFIRLILTYICVLIFLIYFEYYYVWLRKDWNKD